MAAAAAAPAGAATLPVRGVIAVLPVATGVVPAALAVPPASPLPVPVPVIPRSPMPPPPVPDAPPLPAPVPAAISHVVSPVVHPATAPNASAVAAPPRRRGVSASSTSARSGGFASYHLVDVPRHGSAASIARPVARRAAPRVAGASVGRARAASAPVAPAIRVAQRPAPAAAPGATNSLAATILDPLKLLPVPDWSRPIILGLLLVALLAGIRAFRNGRVAQRLRRRGEAMREDLESMQGALAPALEPQIGPLAVTAAYRPADGPAAGGDFYDVFVRRDGQVAIIMGDVSGHGREALNRAAHMRYTLRAYLEVGLSPRDALALAGEALLERGGEKFTTVAVGLYDPVAATLSYSTAGHAPPILLGTPLRDVVTACSSPPIGLGMPTGRRQTTVSLPAGASACFFSDGLTEARTADGMLGRERLLSMLAEGGADADAAALLGHVRAVALDRHDDMATCIVRPSAGEDAGVCCEVIELDATHLASPKVDQFLQLCGASHDASFQAIADAHAVAAARGSAVLHIDRAREPVEVTVAWPHSPTLTLRTAAQDGPPRTTSGQAARARATQVARSADAGELVLTPPR